MRAQLKVIAPIIAGLVLTHCSAKVSESPRAKKAADEATAPMISEVAVDETGFGLVAWQGFEGLLTSLVLARDAACEQKVFAVNLSDVSAYTFQVFEQDKFYVCVFGYTAEGEMIAAENNGVVIDLANPNSATPVGQPTTVPTSEVEQNSGASAASDSANDNTDSSDDSLTRDGDNENDPVDAPPPVVMASVTLQCTATEMLFGLNQQLALTASYSDGSTETATRRASWSSSDTDIASVDSDGLVTAGTKAGVVEIAATFMEASAKCVIDVRAPRLVQVRIDPELATTNSGFSQAFQAMAYYEDNTVENVTAEAAWSVDEASLGSIGTSGGNEGVVTTTTAGKQTVRVVYAGRGARASLLIGASQLTTMALNQENVSVNAGVDVQFAVAGTFSDDVVRDVTGDSTFTSSAPAIADFSTTPGEEGLLKTFASGTVTITATSGSKNVSTTVAVLGAALESIAISPGTLGIPLGTTQNFAAIGSFSDGSTQDLTNQVSWDSSDSAVAPFDPANPSTVDALSLGSSTISASFMGVDATPITLTVTGAVIETITIAPAGTGSYSYEVPAGLTMPLYATGVYTDGTTADITTTATWSSQNETYATVSNAPGTEGVATGVAPGSTNIQAFQDGVTGSFYLSISTRTLDSVAITPTTNVIVTGTTLKLQAIATFSGSVIRQIEEEATWSTGNGSILGVNNNLGLRGRMSGLSAGSTNISINYHTESDTDAVEVRDATTQSITIDQARADVPINQNLDLTAAGTFDVAPDQDMSLSVTWSSSDNSVVAVSNEIGTEGRLLPVSEGTAMVTASFGGQSATIEVKVWPYCEGSLVGGYCWYKANNCATHCAEHGGYHEATRTFAGSEGTNANCEAVIEAIDGTDITVEFATGDQGYGCYTAASSGSYRVIDTTTTAGADTSGRVCACNQ